MPIYKVMFEQTSAEPRSKRFAGSGLTTIEVLLGLSILTLLAVLALPAFGRILDSYRLRTAAWQVAGDLRWARQQAVATKLRHRLCIANCGGTVPAIGYLLEREEGGWQVVEAVDFTSEFVGRGLVLSANVDAITFNALGTAGPGTVTLTNPSGTYEVVTAQSGRVRICGGSC